jgi:hypothetical protein
MAVSNTKRKNGKVYSYSAQKNAQAISDGYFYIMRLILKVNA